MPTNKEIFLKLVSPEKTDTVKRNRERIKNRDELRKKRKIFLDQLEKD